MDANLNMWQSLVLAVVQGVTEFLPVSSSGHLILLRKIFGWSDEGGLVFDTVLHGGSLAGILIYFWREWLAIVRAYVFWSKIENRKSLAACARAPARELGQAEIENSYYLRLPWLVAAATIPVIVAGPVLKPLVEIDAVIRNASITGLSMIMTAFLFFLAEYRKSAANPDKKISFANALFIGCMQIVALLPGASRSGWTTAGGLFCGQRREEAVRFAFYMAVPAIAGAIIFQAKDILSLPQSAINPTLLLAGFAASFISSLAAIHFCLKFFRFHSLRPFAIYLFVAGLISIFLK
jgi:undecaprenyl-diphosphatase